MSENVFKAIRPLRFVFWGGLLCLLDFSINGFDLLNDVLGAILILVGVWGLAEIPVDCRYARAMEFVRVMAILSVFTSLYAYSPAEAPAIFSAGLSLLAVVSLAAVVVFCVAMRWFCETYGLRGAAESWRMTTILFGALIAAPLGLFYLAAAGATVAGQSFHFNLGAWVLLLMLLVVIPLVHLFVSTSRMLREARAMAAAGVLGDLPPGPAEPRSPLQFTIRTLMLVTLLVAVALSFTARPTTSYWHAVLAMLLGLGVALWLVRQRKLAGAAFALCALMMLGGMVAIASGRSVYSMGMTTGFAEPQEGARRVEHLRQWLLAQGFSSAEPPTPRRPRSHVVWSRGSQEPPKRTDEYYRYGQSAGGGEIRIHLSTRESGASYEVAIRMEKRGAGFPWEAERSRSKLNELFEKVKSELRP